MNRNEKGWDDVAAAARKGFAAGVDAWCKGTQVIGGAVHGSDAYVMPGDLTSSRPFEGELRASLTAGGASQEVARAMARDLWDAWKAWADGFQCALPGMFPVLTSYPGAHAPPTPGQGVAQLNKATSSGEVRLARNVLGGKLARVPVRQGDDRRAVAAAMEELAAWVEKRFKEWKARSFLDGSQLHATGPVPTYSPPDVPAGPVVGGSLVPGGGTGVFRGPSFGS